MRGILACGKGVRVAARKLRIHTTTWPVCCLLLFTMTQPVNAARLLGPPVEELLASPELVRVAVAMTREKREPPRVEFEITERLSGESPDTVVLRLDDEAYADVTVGQEYVIGWTDQRKIRLLREGYEKDPDGPSIVTVRGLSTVALYENSPDIRYLFTPRNSSSVDDAEGEIDALLAQIERDDFRSRDLAVGQLYLKPELGQLMNRAQADELRQILQSPGLSAQHRNFLLQSASRLPQELRAQWLAEEYRKVIILHGSQYDLKSFVPGLVKNSAQGLGKVGDPEDIELLNLLLYANNPGVVKAALASMNQLDRPAAVARVEQAVARPWIASQTRRDLEKFLEEPSRSVD